MTLLMKWMLAGLLALMAAMPLAFAQAQRAYSEAELDRMLAPIALYPDPLLSQILMASTYPIEVAEAARWSRANPGLQGDDAVRAVQNEDWDPSVKSLAAFPQVLARMNENLEWTRSLGDAFLAQQPHVMDAVQRLRQRARAAGNLQSSEQLYVQEQGQAIFIQPASPQYVYVPYYDPRLVYGPWWWPAYPPVVWAPWPGYVRYYRPGVSVSFWWGAPIGLSAGFFFANCDWRERQVRVVTVNNYYYRPPVAVENRGFGAGPGRWQHDPQHRRGLEYRGTAMRQQFAGVPPERRGHRFEKPPARDLQNSQVLSPQPPRLEERRQETRDERRPPEVRAQAQSRLQPQTPPARAQHEQQSRMPAAAAPQQPRAERQEQRREERREQHREERKEHRPRGSERS